MLDLWSSKKKKFLPNDNSALKLIRALDPMVFAKSNTELCYFNTFIVKSSTFFGTRIKSILLLQTQIHRYWMLPKSSKIRTHLFISILSVSNEQLKNFCWCDFSKSKKNLVIYLDLFLIQLNFI